MSNSENGASYYIRVRGRILGPYDVTQLKTLRGRGQFSRANEVSTDRQTWQSAATIEHLIGGTTRAASTQDSPKESALADKQRLDADVAAAPNRSAKPTWHYAVGEEQYGPVTLLELRGLISTGQLSTTDLVWKDGLEAWTPLGDIPELNAVRTNEPDQRVQQSVPPAITTDVDLERQHIVDTYALSANLRSAGLTGVFPFQAWVRDRPLSLVWIQLLVFLFSFPLLLSQYYVARKPPLDETVWAFSLYFAIVDAAILHRCVRPEPVGMARIFGVWLFTGLLGVALVVLASALGSVLPFARDAFVASQSANILGRLVGMTLAVGLVEEFAKAMPLLWIASRSSKAMTPNTGAFVGCISGLAFGSTEAVMYSMMYALNHATSAQRPEDYGLYIVSQILRFVSLPLLHGIWSGISGYYIFLARTSKGSRGSMAVLGLMLVACLHGAYNTLIGEPSLGWLGAAVAIFSLMLFVGYIRSGTQAGSNSHTPLTKPSFTT